MLSPDIVLDSALDATPELLAGHGVEGVLVDLDDTLMAAGHSLLDPRVGQWLDGLRAAGMPVVMLSNGERERVIACCSELGIEGLHLAGKPFWWAFRKGLRLLGTPPARSAMIGDQLFTDVLGANLAGMISVLVRPLSPGRLPHTKALRHLENRLLREGRHGRSIDR